MYNYWYYFRSIGRDQKVSKCHLTGPDQMEYVLEYFDQKLQKNFRIWWIYLIILLLCLLLSILLSILLYIYFSIQMHVILMENEGYLFKESFRQRLGILLIVYIGIVIYMLSKAHLFGQLMKD
jgi:hypothetical protein